MRAVALACLVVVGLSPRPVAATIVSHRPLTELVASADVIVVASVSTKASSASGLRMTLEIRRTLKGEPVAGAVEATLPWQDVHHLGEDSHGIWFLSRTKVPGSFVAIAPIRNGSLLRDAFVALAPECAPGERPLSGELPLDRIAEEFRASLACGAPVPRIAPAVEAAVGLVNALDSSDRAESVAGSVSKAGAARALATEFDVTVAALIEAEILGGRADAVPGEFVIALYSVGKPTAAPALVRIVDALGGSTSGTAGNRWFLFRGAVQALVNIHTEETLPTLARLLDHSDVEIRQLAVIGIGSHANGFASGRSGSSEPRGPAPFASSQTRRNMPATDIFRADPERYVAFWRRWLTCLPCRLDLGVPRIEVKSGGACAGTTCTIVFTADASDPDGDNVRVSWNGCAVDVTKEMECTAVARAPGMVEVMAVARDAYDMEKTAKLQVHTHAAAFDASAWTACGPAGLRTRTVTVSALTLDPALAVPAPASVEACRSR